MNPTAVVAVKGLGRVLTPTQLLTVAKDVIHLRRYLTGSADADPPEVVKARIHATFDRFTSYADVPAEALRPVKDYLIGRLVSEFGPDLADPQTTIE
jgi:hypothetical protein